MDDSKKHFLFIALIISLITVSAIIYIVITQPTRIEIDEIKVILKDLNSKTDKMKNLFEHKKKFYEDFESLDKLFELN